MADAGSEPAYGYSYADRLDLLYLKVQKKVAQLDVPTMKIVSTEGSSPPGSQEFQQAIKSLYAIGYAIRMGLKNGSLPVPPGYFDYKVGALEALWWNSENGLDAKELTSFSWKLYLMVPDFVDENLLADIRQRQSEKHPELDFGSIQLETRAGETAIQMLHVGPYRDEASSIAKLRDYASLHYLEMFGPHHEIYISDPGRTRPERLKTVIRYAVRSTRAS